VCFSASELRRLEGAVFAEVEATLCAEMGRKRLPRAPAATRGHPFASRERSEDSLHRKAAGQIFEEIGAVVAAPEFGADQYVSAQRTRVFEDASWPTPAVNTGVKIKRRDTHLKTLRRGEARVWQSLVVDSVNVSFGHRLWWVDAFIGDAERGNPAVVVLLERPMDDHELQQIAFELGVSETAFVRRVGDTWSLRWFTPTVEVDLCGHATLATLHVLLTELGVPGGEFYFQTRSGVLSGRRLKDGLLGVDLPRWYIEPLDDSVLNGTLGPVREVYQAGAQSVLAVVEDYDTLCGLSVDPMSLFLVPSSIVIDACHGGPNVDVSIRVFAPRLGLAEDHVTGSAMCAVSPWWVEKVGSPTVSVRQASARGGVMHARLFEKNVEVAGIARTFFGGDLRA
jgi:predicted PhzF superfamily epimerase YddE/YHI9